MSKQKYYYAIVNKKTNQLYCESEKLPIYWFKKTAKDRMAKLDESKVKIVKIQGLFIDQSLYVSTDI